MSQNVLALNEQLCFSYYTLYRLFNQLYKEALSEFNLTYTQYLVLTILWTSDQQSLHAIGAQLDLTSNTLTPLLKRLEEKGLIKRERPDKDKRQLIVSLTELGKTTESAVTQNVKACYQSIDGLDKQMVQKLIIDNHALIDLMKD